MTNWIPLVDAVLNLSTYRVMAAVGTDLRAIVSAAVRRDNVRKRGLRGSEYSRTPLDSLPAGASVDVDLNCIRVPNHFGPGWTDVVVAEADLYHFLSEEYGIEILEAPAAPSGCGQSPDVTPRRPQGFDYRESDALLVEEGLKGITAGTFRNATDAGRQLAQRAKGHGTVESKATRLARRIKAGLPDD